MNWPSHGSNPQHLFKALGLPEPSELLDFSANINPMGPPERLKADWHSFFNELPVYPDPFAAELTARLAQKEGIAGEYVLAGNGASELISLAARLLAGKKVMIVQPAFSEYEQACRVNDCDISYFQLEEGGWELDTAKLCEAGGKADALFLCNPANPTGRYYGRAEIVSLLEGCPETLVIVDEAFYDFLPDYESLVPLLSEYKNLMLLRSMTKMFSIPGLRLGYVLAEPELIRGMARFQYHWSINSAAQQAGLICLDEDLYIEETQIYMEKERSRLFNFYKAKGLLVSESKTNFYLLRDPELGDQEKLFFFLLEKGVVPRHTYNFPGLSGRWLRFAVKGKEDNQKLMEAIDEWTGQKD
ncbi:threonine-phosphate decarboxylase [Bacillus sp. OG2]|nr:threonine-phosphate decarboxylase [Bacillus sp. OG2]